MHLLGFFGMFVVKLGVCFQVLLILLFGRMDAYQETKVLVWVMFALIILMTVWCAMSTRTHALRKQKVPVEGASKGNYESVAVVQGRARKKLVYLAKVVSFISIVTTLMGGMTGVILYFVFNSSQLLLYGLENIVDIISSVLVLWRFAQEGKGDADPFKAQSLETRGSVGIAMCFVALSIFIFCSAGVGLVTEHTIEQGSDTEALQQVAVASAVFLLLLGIAKVTLSSKLTSKVLKKDGICTLAGCLLSIGVCVGTSLAAQPALWSFDACFSVIVAYGLFLSGMRTLLLHDHKWWHKSFWFMGELRAGIDAMADVVALDVQTTTAQQAQEAEQGGRKGSDGFPIPSIFPGSARRNKRNHDLIE